MKNLIQLLVIWMAVLGTVNAQRIVVLDAEDREPIPFVHVKAWNSRQATFTDLDGTFRFPQSILGDSLSFELIGYRPFTMVIQSDANDTVMLYPDGVGLEEVVITPTENPAWRIVRQAIENRKENDVLRRDGFHYVSNNKLKLAPEKGSSFADSSLLRHVDLFLMETATEVWRLGGGRRFEQVKGSRISGYPGRALPLTAGDLQSVTPYDELVEVLGEKFLSPISSQALNRYAFEWIDTIPSGDDSLCVIRFEPRKGNWNALAGVLHIHTRNFAVVHLDVSLVVRETPLVAGGGTIRQLYSPMEDSLWVPTQLWTELELLPFSKSVDWTMTLSGRSDLSNFTRSAPPRKPSGVEVELLPDAGLRQDSLRRVPLTLREERTYAWLDSLGRDAKLNWWLDQAYLLQEGMLGLGPVNLDLEHILLTNRVERWRAGLGLRTSDQLWKRASIGGWAMMGGERDVDLQTRLKYGADIRLTPLGTPAIQVEAGFRRDLVEACFARLGHPASHPLYRGLSREVDARSFYLERMDYVEQQFASFSVELPAHISLRLDGSRGSITPAYAYTFRGDSVFDATDLGGVLRWAPGEKFSFEAGKRILMENHLPVVIVRVGQGTVSGRSFSEDYQFGEAVLAHSFEGPFQMKVRYRFQVGKWLGSLPLSRMYTFRGNDARGQSADVLDAFNTMGVQEFVAKEYATGWVELSPRLNWLGIGRWRPRLSLSCGAAMGRLSDADASLHQGVVLSAPNGIYLEPGLVFRNLFPSPKKDTLIRGIFKAFSVGVYYRGAKDEQPRWPGSLAFRAGFRL